MPERGTGVLGRAAQRKPAHAGVAPALHTERPGALERAAQAVATWAGGTAAFTLASLAVLAWFVTGPLFEYSENWQLVINTGTTIVTFLMVFLIQRSQNKESRAIQLKLSEIVAALEGASNHLIGAEELSEHDLEKLAQRFRQLQARSQGRHPGKGSLSVEDADDGDDKA